MQATSCVSLCGFRSFLFGVFATAPKRKGYILRLVPILVFLLPLLLMVHSPIVAAATSDFTMSSWWTYDTGTPFNTVILTGMNGFSGLVTLTLSTPAGFYASLNRSNVTLSTTTTSAQVTLQASGGPSPPGNYSDVIDKLV